MATFTIHYSAWPDGVIPAAQEVSDATTPHGLDGTVLSFSRTPQPDYDHLFEAPYMYLAADLLNGTVAPDALAGYFVQFAGPGGMFTYECPIDRVVKA